MPKIVDVGHSICCSADALYDATTNEEDRGISCGSARIDPKNNDEATVISHECTSGCALAYDTTYFIIGEPSALGGEETIEDTVKKT